MRPNIEFRVINFHYPSKPIFARSRAYNEMIQVKSSLPLKVFNFYQRTYPEITFSKIPYSDGVMLCINKSSISNRNQCLQGVRHMMRSGIKSSPRWRYLTHINVALEYNLWNFTREMALGPVVISFCKEQDIYEETQEKPPFSTGYL